MNGEHISPAEFKKLEPNFYTVIADDEPYNSDRSERAIKEGFSSSSLTHGGIFKANNVMELLQQALFGKDGEQADVVLLDHDFGQNFGDWNSKDEDLLLLAEQAGIDFSPFVIPDRGGLHVIGKMPDDLHFPDSINLAMLSRIFKFQNNIFVVSNGPPDPETIMYEVNRLAESTPEFAPNFPINGFSMKKPYLGKIMYANAIDQFGWQSKELKGTLTQSLQKLFINF